MNQSRNKADFMFTDNKVANNITTVNAGRKSVFDPSVCQTGMGRSVFSFGQRHQTGYVLATALCSI